MKNQVFSSKKLNQKMDVFKPHLLYYFWFFYYQSFVFRIYQENHLLFNLFLLYQPQTYYYYSYRDINSKKKSLNLQTDQEIHLLKFFPVYFQLLPNNPIFIYIKPRFPLHLLIILLIHHHFMILILHPINCLIFSSLAQYYYYCCLTSLKIMISLFSSFLYYYLIVQYVYFLLLLLVHFQVKSFMILLLKLIICLFFLIKLLI